MQGVPGAQAEFMTVHEPRRRTELNARYAKDSQGVGDKPTERRQRGRPVYSLDLAGSQLDRERRRKLCDDPITDGEAFRILLDQPGLGLVGARFIRQRGDQKRRIKIGDQ